MTALVIIIAWIAICLHPSALLLLIPTLLIWAALGWFNHDDRPTKLNAVRQPAAAGSLLMLTEQEASQWGPAAATDKRQSRS